MNHDQTNRRARAGVTGLILLAPLAFVACGGETENLPPPPPPPIASTTSTSTATPPMEDAGPPAPAAPPVTLESGAASPDPAAPLPLVKITAPAKGQIIPAGAKLGEFAIKLDVKNWKTAMGDAHVHLILDNQPYKPIYDTKAPIKLSELPNGEKLEEGQHVLVAFPSRANHESVKTRDAVAIVEFFVGKKGDKKLDTAKPFLIYSRPKGDYKGEMANHVLVDFQLANVTLAEGKEHVTVAVTGPGIDGEKTAKVDKFGAPLYLNELRNGDYTLKLELVGADGKVLPGPWNSTTRTIKVDRNAPAETTHAPAAPPATPAPAPANPK